MNKLVLSVVATSLALSGCTYKISKGIADDGTSAEKIIFPDKEDAWKNEGVFPNLQNLENIDKGISKDDLYYLIGAPHFSEAQHAKEWDYIFKFKNNKTGSIDICQYKVLFDKEYKGQSFYWLPSSCADLAKSNWQKITNESKVNSIVALNDKRDVAGSENIHLDGDALFEFNKWKLSNVTDSGIESLNNLVNKIKKYKLTNKVKVEIIGHTDRLGSKIYNEKLSLKRAQTIKTYLISKGIDASSIQTFAAADINPKTSCYGKGNQTALIACLQPNRRVEIKVTTY